MWLAYIMYRAGMRLMQMLGKFVCIYKIGFIFIYARVQGGIVPINIGIQKGQKKVLHPLGLGLQAVMNFQHEFWELNSDPLKEQQVLFTFEQSLQTLHEIFRCTFSIHDLKTVLEYLALQLQPLQPRDFFSSVLGDNLVFPLRVFPELSLHLYSLDYK